MTCVEKFRCVAFHPKFLVHMCVSVVTVTYNVLAGRIRVPSTSSKGEDTTDLLDVKDELTFYQYKVGMGVLHN